MADDDGDGFFLPTDAFVEVLLRLPTSSRRRFRLVCKRWRHIIDERTPERLVRSKILAFFSEAGVSHAVLLPDQPQPDGSGSGQEWAFPSSKSTTNSNTYVREREAGVVHLVGTCNGLLCLRDDVPDPGGGTTHSTISITNPVTGEKAVILRWPISWPRYSSLSRKVVKYGFGYHPTTGEYKVVMVLCLPSSTYYYTKRLEIDRVLVYTLGEMDSGWRKVPVLASPADTGSYHDSGDVVTVDGSTYWLTGRANRVVALDLSDERVASFEAPASLQLLQVPEKATCQLTSVDGRLGVLVTRKQPTAARVDVWVLEGGGGGERQPPRWSRRWSLLESNGGDDLGRWITSPHFIHCEYVLSKRVGRSIDNERWLYLYRCKVGDLTNGGGKNAELWPLDRAERIMGREFNNGGVVTFPYVETTEPLPIY
ncbi:unnamed protein product [Urochloa humidicola]